MRRESLLLSLLLVTGCGTRVVVDEDPSPEAATGNWWKVTTVQASHVIADPVRGVFYATVGDDAPEFASSLVVVATSGEVLSSVFVGSRPWTMALSDDASTLWVSLRGSHEIRRVDLTPSTPVAEEQFQLPPASSVDPAYAGEMVVLPGTTDSVALSLHQEDDLIPGLYVRSVVLDSGVPRPDATPGNPGPSRLTGGPNGWLFGFDHSSGGPFYSLEVSANGLSSTPHEDLIDEPLAHVVYSDGRVYATSGDVVDVSNPASPAKAGELLHGGEAVLPLAPSPHLLLLSMYPTPMTLRSFDTTTFSLVDSRNYPDLEIGGADDLVSPDGKSLAFIAFGASFDDPPRMVVLANPFDGE